MHKTEFYVHDLFSIKHNNAQMFENVQYDMDGKCRGYVDLHLIPQPALR